MAFIATAALPAAASAAPAIPDPDYGPGPAVVAPGTMTSAFDSLQSGDSTLVLGTDGSRTVIGAVDSWGDHDPGFGSGGVLALELPVGTEVEPTGGSLAVSPLGGYVGIVSRGDSSYLFRLTQAGRVDEAFGASGWVVLPDRRSVVSVDAAGRVVTMGYGEFEDDPSSPGLRAGLVVRRFEPDGATDVSFADGGEFRVVTLSSHPVTLNGSTVQPRDVVVHPSGEMTFASWLDPVQAGGSEWWLLRLDPAGEQVADAKLYDSGQGPFSFLHRAVAGPGESLLVGGSVAAPKVNGSYNGWDQIAGRLDQSLAPDPAFGDAGFSAANVGSDPVAGFIARAGGGRIYSARTTDRPSRLVVDRFGADGRSDPGYSAAYDQPAGDAGRLVDLTVGPGEAPTALLVVGPEGDGAAPATRVELVRFVESREATPPVPARFRHRVLRRHFPRSTRRLLRRGVAIRVYCSRACLASVALRVPRRVAKAANVFSPVARYGRRLGPGAHWMRVPLDVAVRRVLRADPAPLRGIRARVRFTPLH